MSSPSKPCAEGNGSGADNNDPTPGTQQRGEIMEEQPTMRYVLVFLLLPADVSPPYIFDPIQQGSGFTLCSW